MPAAHVRVDERRPRESPWRVGPASVAGVLASVLAVLLLAWLDREGVLARGAVPLSVIGALCVAAALYPRLGLYGLVALALLADYKTWGFAAWTQQLGFFVYQNWWKLVSPPGSREFDWLILNTVEALLLSTALGVAIRVARGRAEFVFGHEAALTLAFLATVAVMLVYGLATGGDPRPALWQVRPYTHLAAFALITPHVLRSRAHVRGLIWVIIAVVSFKALQIGWIFLHDAGARFGEWREILGHEDSVFLVSAIAFTAALTLYDVERPQQRFLQLATALLLIALVVNLRRAGYVALVFSLALVPIVLHGRRAAAIKLSLGLIASGVAYCALFWSDQGPLGIPVQKLRSVLAADAGSSDYMSNLYRVLEGANLQYTINQHPLGLGFGHPFDVRVPLPDISSNLPFWQYHPHDMVLGMWVSLGSVGFVIFLTFISGIIMLASFYLRRAHDLYLKAVCFFVLSSFASGFLVSAVDQFVWSERGAIFLGLLIGILAAVGRLVHQDAPVSPDVPAAET